ncbi:MAG: ribosome recycling factor [Saccharofermentanales bacterium]
MIEITKELFIPYEEKMVKIISHLKEDFNTIRAGRANARVLDKIGVEYYGTMTPVNQLANIQVPEARMITITPFDPSILKAIEKAIQTSDLGINPNSDGKIIRLVFPSLTEDRRKELTRTVAKHGEEAKVSVRTVRRDAIEKFKGMEKKKEISVDMLADAEDQIQKITDIRINEIDKLIAEKDKELLAV